MAIIDGSVGTGPRVVEASTAPNQLIIDDSNFHEYFFDVRNHRPQRDQIMARYSAIAEFVDGPMKKNVIDLLMNKNKASAATQVMRKLACATEGDSIKICREICEDLASGMSLKEVEEKVYKYTIEVFYYTKKEYVPTDDPHWTTISISNLDEFLDAAGQKITMKAKVVEGQ